MPSTCVAITLYRQTFLSLCIYCKVANQSSVKGVEHTPSTNHILYCSSSAKQKRNIIPFNCTLHAGQTVVVQINTFGKGNIAIQISNKQRSYCQLALLSLKLLCPDMDMLKVQDDFVFVLCPCLQAVLIDNISPSFMVLLVAPCHMNITENVLENLVVIRDYLWQHRVAARCHTEPASRLGLLAGLLMKLHKSL